MGWPETYDQLDHSRTPEEENNMRITEKELEVLDRLVAAWIVWRSHHNIESNELNCCQVSHNLFSALKDYEQVMTDGIDVSTEEPPL